jgi:putative addiction module killer protein
MPRPKRKWSRVSFDWRTAIRAMSLPVGDGISELRINHGPGYRVYYVRREDAYVALCGGDKSTQSKDINLAKALAADIEG